MSGTARADSSASVPGGSRRREERVWRESTGDGLSLLAATYENQRFTEHAQDTFVIGTNVQGSASCFGQSSLVASPGSLVVIPPGRPHDGHKVGENPWRYLAVYPTREYLKSLLHDVTADESAEPGFTQLLYPDRDLVRRFVHAHAATLLDEEPLACETAMLEALAVLLERYSTPRRSPRKMGREPHRVSRAVEYIEANLEASPTLTEIASVTGLSRFHFLRVFKHETGYTPFAYLMQRRVERARHLIRSGTPLAEAAYGAGFADQAHLSRRFRQMIGVTPGEFARGTEAHRARASEAARHKGAAVRGRLRRK